MRTKNTDRIVIFKSYEYGTELKDTFNSYYNNGNQSNSGWLIHPFCHATEEEKQAFFDNLKAKGLHWNAETKKMEKIRKRAKKGEKYLHIIGIGYICEFTENYDSGDNNFYNSGNYYLLSEREEAEEDAKAIRAFFEKRKKVIQD